MGQNIAISADSTCDINEGFRKKYKIAVSALHVNLDGKDYSDGIDIDPDHILRVYGEKKILPKTSSISEEEYADHFRGIFSQGADEIIHISLSSKISSTYQNAKNASIKLGNVYTVDSHNLSLGSGILAMEAHKKISKFPVKTAQQIAEELTILREKCDVSFVLSTLDFMASGGRCPGLIALGANILNIKPCIKVNSKEGKMSVGKMYRGKLETVLPKYIADRLSLKEGFKGIANSRVFVVHSGVDKELLDISVEAVRKSTKDCIKEIVVSRAGCTITCHCGLNTVGIVFLWE
ncbi:MAG: DegV family protein [Oscillospiraceae bacterium]|jgi:DegV family protein with EDD domain|nr:DegV family protein [Oscillospiraceae bacterium]